jgi:predicted transcriptional regulator
MQQMSTSTTIRVRETTRRALSALAAQRRSSITEVIDQLVEQADADAMFDAHHEAMAPGEQESRYLEGTLMDGLQDDPWPLDEHGHPAR